MPRRRRRRRKVRAPTRRLLPRLRSSTPAPSAGLRCPTRKPSSSTLRANIPNPPCLLSSPTSWPDPEPEPDQDPDPTRTRCVSEDGGRMDTSSVFGLCPGADRQKLVSTSPD